MQARPDAQERHLRGDHSRVLELVRCRGRQVRMAGLGIGELRQGAAAPGRPRGAWRRAHPLPERQSRNPEMKSIEVARLTEESELKRFMNGLLERSPAQQTEVMVSEWDSALTRFANNGIHQNVAERNVSVRERVVKDGKTGLASINQMNQAAATDVLNRRIAIAHLQPEGELVPEAGP